MNWCDSSPRRQRLLKSNGMKPQENLMNLSFFNVLPFDLPFSPLSSFSFYLISLASCSSYLFPWSSPSLLASLALCVCPLPSSSDPSNHSSLEHGSWALGTLSIFKAKFGLKKHHERTLVHRDKMCFREHLTWALFNWKYSEMIYQLKLLLDILWRPWKHCPVMTCCRHLYLIVNVGQRMFFRNYEGNKH